MKLLRDCFLGLFLIASSWSVQAAWRPGEENALTRYLKAADDSFAWRVAERSSSSTRLRLTSQTWQGKPWQHDLWVVRPDTNRHPDIALLLVAGSSSTKRYGEVLAKLANRAGALVVMLDEVPNQPRFGRKEDALIAHSFEQYIRSGDETWPALFPMVKAAVKAMDAITAFTAGESTPVRRFVVTGASKRGWTTWLTGANDRRVVGIAPMVFDILNSKVQTDWARTVWGRQSEQIHDYTDAGLIREEEHPRMKQIREWVDPFEYRRRLSMPKLLLLGSNDPYWVVDSARHYWHELVEPKLMCQIPNTGHGLDETEVVRTLGAFYADVAAGRELPSLRWQSRETGVGEHEIRVDFTGEIKAWHYWTARSEKRDFRKSEWTRRKLTGVKGAVAKLRRRHPAKGYEAVILQATYADHAGREYRLSTEPFVFPLLRGQKVDTANARRPRNDTEKSYWLDNLINIHGFGPGDVARATGLDEEAVAPLLQSRVRSKSAGLTVVPFPGGWHPRIGFLDGAVAPQRETKISVFTPWDPGSFVVVDVPEAIWSNLGLTYLAHTHVPTIWTEAEEELPKLEWTRHEGGRLEVERSLPNGTSFDAVVRPRGNEVAMELRLHNGTKERLTGLRVQNCVMLKGAPEFTRQANDNKLLEKPFIAVRNDAGTRWVITAWTPNHRVWGNAMCPCLHSDPVFPDTDPGGSSRVRGWLTFYEGTDIRGELARLRERWGLR